jgi:hypothetical protein
MDYIVGYISGELRYVTDMLEHMGWRRMARNRFGKNGRCIFWCSEKYHLQGIEGQGRKFLAVRGSTVSEQFARERRFTVVHSVEDFLK